MSFFSKLNSILNSSFGRGAHFRGKDGAPVPAAPQPRHYRNLSRRHGFTLLELIVTVTVITVLTSVMVPSATGYLVSSEMMKLNQTAKTIFLASQDYLSQAQSSGELAEINRQSIVVDGSKISPAVTGSEDKNNFEKSNIKYLRLSKDGVNQTPILNKILESYFAGNDILQNSVLVEYNYQTGIVRSVFYSEKADYLTYDGGSSELENVCVRAYDSLRAKRQGYYGLDYTGEYKEILKLEKTKPELVNEDRLSLRWNDVAPSGLTDKVSYNVSIYSAKSGSSTQPCLVIKNIPSITKLPQKMVSDQSKVDESVLLSGPRVTTGTGPSGGQFLIYASSDNKINLVLDDYHRSIFEQFASIPQGNIYAVVETVATDGAVMDAKDTSNVENSYFEDENTADGTVKSFGIANVRHFNNIRYGKSDTDYEQYTDINWTTIEGKANTDPFTDLIFRYRDSADNSVVSDGTTYQGVYQCTKKTNSKPKPWITYKLSDSPRAQIKNLTLTENSGGLFESIKGKSESDTAGVRNISLVALQLNTNRSAGAFTALADANSVLSGCRVDKSSSINVQNAIVNVGGLAGSASAGASINDCMNYGQVNAPLARSGGLVGEANAVTISKSNNYGSVTGKDQVGGLIGAIASSTVSNCENQGAVTATGSHVGGLLGTSSGTQITKSVNTGKVTGKVNVGGLVGLCNTDLIGLENRGEIVGVSIVGGIVGANGEGRLIQDCKNSGVVRADDVLNLPAQEYQYLGGISGKNSGQILNCSNLTTSLVKDTALENAMNGYANKNFGPLLGDSKSTRKLYGKYVGGITGENASNGVIKNYKVNALVVGQSYVGGIAGTNSGEIDYAEHKESVNGIVVASGDYAGGFAGENLADRGLVDFNSSAHVLADNFAGGVIGVNGKADSDLEYLIDKSHCSGAVYAYTSYAGGITGANYGTITKSDSVWSGADELGKLILKNPNDPKLEKWKHGSYIGGIVGYNAGGIYNCEGANLVLGNNYIGGVIGHNDDGKVQNCQTTGGYVVASGDYAGGFIGKNNSSSKDTPLGDGGEDVAVNQLISKAKLVTGRYFVGGIIGCNLTTDGSSDKITTIIASNGSDQSRPQIIGEAYVGGIIGYNGIEELALGDNPKEVVYKKYEGIDSSDTSDSMTTRVKSCYNYGSVTGVRYVGGLIGLNSSESHLEVNVGVNFGNVTARELSGGNRVTDSFYFVGGITGRNTKEGKIIDSRNEGKIVSPSMYTGGLVEVNEGFIQKCFNMGSVSSSKGYVGGIAGLNGKNAGDTARIVDCAFALEGSGASIEGKDFVGGIAGENRATIENCYIQGGTVSGNDAVGGITGFNNEQGSILGCETKGGTVRGRNFVGGLVGYNNSANATGTDGSLKDLSNNAAVLGQYYVGGIAGYHIGSKIENCKNGRNALVVGTSGADSKGTMQQEDITFSGGPTDAVYDKETGASAGGIIGFNRLGSIISNCANYGTVVGTTTDTVGVGGISSRNLGEIKDCTNYGMVIASSNAYVKLQTNPAGLDYKGHNAGGITGLNDYMSKEAISGTVENCKADIESGSLCTVVGGENVGGIVGQNRGILKDPKIEKDDCNAQGYTNVGSLAGYWNKSGVIEFSSEGKEAREIKGTVLLNKSSQIDNNTPVLGGIFGTCDSGMTIENYTSQVKVGNSTEKITSMRTGGIIGYLPSKATVINCQVFGNVTGGGDSGGATGGIVGLNAGTVENCSLQGKVVISGNTVVGGIIGRNNGDGSMKNCATIEGGKVLGVEAFCGGYIGYDDSKTKDIFVYSEEKPLINTLDVIGGSDTGGIVGYTKNNMRWCQNGEGSTVEKRSGQSVGGVVGRVNTTNQIIENCFNYGKVLITAGNQDAPAGGGVVGKAEGTVGKIDNVKLVYCVNYGTVEAVFGNNVGGVVGVLTNGATAENCWNSAEGRVVSDSVSTDRLSGVVGELSNGAVVQNSHNLGLVKNNSRGIGGVVGRLGVNADSQNTQPKVIDCTNGRYSRFIRTSNHETGGIVAQSNGGIIQNCKNYADINGDCNTVGGIVGWSYRGRTEIINCTNYGKISGKNNVGGMIGAIERPLIVTKSVNNADVTGEYNVGGILGYSYAKYIANTDELNISECSNNAVITALKNSAGGIFGCLGESTVISKIDNCENKGAVTGQTGQGGILGSTILNNHKMKLTMTNCTNFGPVASDTNKDGTLGKYGTGGIAGNLGGDLMTVRFCINRASVQADRFVGGITGSVTAQRAKIALSVNSGTIAGVGDNSESIGGIVGLNNGCVYSSRNVQPESKGASVTGAINVGGIAGCNDGPGAVIASTLPADIIAAFLADNPADTSQYLVPTCNEQNVIATMDGAGGIVGHNGGGAVVGVYNKGNVKLASGGKEAGVGGLIGIAEMGSVTNGSKLINSFHLGSTRLGTEKSSCVGGLVGVRSIVDGKTPDQVCHIESSHYWRLGSLLSLSSASDHEELLGVGNEPELVENAAYKLTTAAFTGSPVTPGYTDEMLAVDPPSSTLVNDVCDSIDLLLQKLNYQLPQTSDYASKSLKVYEYTFSWEMVQGLVGGYEISLMDEHGQKLVIGTTDDKLVTSLSVNLADAVASGRLVVGKSYPVTIVTKGMKMDDSNQDLSLDSDNNPFEKLFKVLPVLPAPNFAFGEWIPGDTNPIVGTGGNYTIMIEGAPYGAESIYGSKLINGFLGKFAYEDRDDDSKPVNVVEVDPQPQPPDNGDYGIGRTYTTAQKNNQRYVYVQAKSNDIGDSGYAHSEIKKIVYYVWAKLDTPLNPKSVFKGDLANIQYQLSWDKVQNANYGYEIQIYRPDGTPYGTPFTAVTTLDSSGKRVVCDYTPPQDVKDQELTYTVKALGSKPDYYLDSELSEHCKIIPPLVLEPPTNISHIRDSANDTLYTLNWTAAEGAKSYDISFERRPIGTDVSKNEPYKPYGKTTSTVNVTGTSLALTVPDEDFGFEYTLHFVSKGELGVSYDSVQQDYFFKVPARLKAVAEGTQLEISKVDNPAGEVEFQVKWTKNTGNTAQNCAGYVLKILDNKGAVVAEATTNSDASTINYVFTKDQMYLEAFDPSESFYNVALVALGIDPESSNSKPSGSMTLPLPKPVETPANLRVNKGYPDGTVTLTEEQYKALQPVVQWDVFASGSNQSLYGSGFRYQVFDVTAGEPVALTAEQLAAMGIVDSSSKATTQFVSKIPIELAGKKLRFSVTALANENWGIISQPATVDLELPKLALPAPTEVKASMTVEGKLHVEWKTPTATVTTGNPAVATPVPWTLEELKARYSGFEIEMQFVNAAGEPYVPEAPLSNKEKVALTQMVDGVETVVTSAELSLSSLPSGTKVTFVKVRGIPAADRANQFICMDSDRVEPDKTVAATIALMVGILAFFLKWSPR